MTMTAFDAAASATVGTTTSPQSVFGPAHRRGNKTAARVGHVLGRVGKLLLTLTPLASLPAAVIAAKIAIYLPPLSR